MKELTKFLILLCVVLTLINCNDQKYPSSGKVKLSIHKKADKTIKETLLSLGKNITPEFELSVNSQNNNYIFYSAVGNSPSCHKKTDVVYFDPCFFYNSASNASIESNRLQKKLKFSLINDSNIAQILNNDSVYVHIKGKPMRNLGLEGRIGWGYKTNETEYQDHLPIEVIRSTFMDKNCGDPNDYRFFSLGVLLYDC